MRNDIIMKDSLTVGRAIELLEAEKNISFTARHLDVF